MRTSWCDVHAWCDGDDVFSGTASLMSVMAKTVRTYKHTFAATWLTGSLQQLSCLVPCEGHSRSARGKGESRLLRRRGKLTHSRLDALSTRSGAQTSAQGRAEGRAQVAAPLIRKRASGERSRHRIKLFIATCSCLYTPPIFYDWLSRRFRRSSSCRSSSLLSSSPSSTSSGGEPDHTPMRKERKTNRTMSV